MHTTTKLAAEAMRSNVPAARVAHASLFARIIERIHRYFRRMVRDSHEAEECLQRTLVLLEESLVGGKYEPDRSFNTWMWLKARTVFAQWCREREKRFGSLDGKDAPDPADRVGAVDATIDAAAILDAVRTQLGEETYEAFVLYYDGGLTQAEVAEALDRDRKTIRKRLAEAHELIQGLLEG